MEDGIRERLQMILRYFGSLTNEECKIDSIAQSWSVISGAGDNDKKYISMESLENHLVDKENGIIKLLDPPFEKGDLEPGYIKSYLPGVRENGGQYTHSAIWVIMANSMLGYGDKALELFEMINPIEHSKTREQSKKYKVEPYVIAADVYGKGNLIGRGGWTWYTGSSSWYGRVGIESILGFKIEDGYIKLEPKNIKKWEKYSVRYIHGKSIYNIEVLKNNEDEKINHPTMFFNGEIVPTNRFKLNSKGGAYKIVIRY